jgi:hypothetical protein
LIVAEDTPQPRIRGLDVVTLKEGGAVHVINLVLELTGQPFVLEIV